MIGKDGKNYPDHSRKRPKHPAVPKDLSGLDIGSQFRWLRIHMKPYMTIPQLAVIAEVHPQTIMRLETGTKPWHTHGLATLQRIAHALNADMYVFIRPKNRPQPGVLLTSDRELPEPPVRTGKWKGQHRYLRAKLGRAVQLKRRRDKRHELAKRSAYSLSYLKKDPPSPVE